MTEIQKCLNVCYEKFSIKIHNLQQQQRKFIQVMMDEQNSFEHKIMNPKHINIQKNINSQLMCTLPTKKQENSFGIQNNINFQRKTLKQSQKESQNIYGTKNFYLLLYFLTAIIITEFSIHLCILVLQQNSSKINLTLFCILLVSEICISSIVAVGLYKIIKNDFKNKLKIEPRQFVESPLVFDFSAPSTTTQPIIRRGAFLNQNQRTRKLKKPAPATLQNPTDENLMKFYHGSNIEEQTILDKDQLLESNNLLVYSKIFHALFTIIFASVFIGTIQNHSEVSFSSQLVLLIITYPLCGLSLFLLFKVNQKVQQAVKNQQSLIQPNLSVKMIKPVDVKQISKPLTVLSIQQQLQQISQKLSDNVSFGKIQTPKSQSNPHSQILNIAEEQCQAEDGNQSGSIQVSYGPSTPKSPTSLCQNPKFQIKKSVLKSSKSNRPRNKTQQNFLCPHQQEDEFPERRKVAINSKKIQFFEYKASESSSIACSQESNRPKSAYNEKNRKKHRNKYNKQKLKKEAMMLKQNLQLGSIRKRSKSQNCRSAKLNLD